LQQNEMISQYKQSIELAFQSLIPKEMFYWHTYDCFFGAELCTGSKGITLRSVFKKREVWLDSSNKGIMAGDH